MKFRKKPVVIEAYQTKQPLIIETLEGDMRAKVGDWIITGVNGEQYPCDNEIFQKTYEAVDEETETAFQSAKKETKLSPCIICGKDWTQEDELIDTLYPSKRDPYTGEFTEWNVVCQIHNTGCGRTVYGLSKQEAVDRWNKGDTDESVSDP